MSFAAIEAQPSAVRVLQHALEHDRMAQAYLFAGPAGVGKQKAALALARAALCPEQPKVGCDRCDVCTRIDAGIHPDVRVFAPRDEGDRNLKVEYLRSEVLPLTKFAPFEGRMAFFIFPEADVSFPEIHAEAANAMLKTLEEPRAAVCFVLLSARPDQLLATIRSRCQRVRFSALPGPVVDRILEAQGIAPEARRSAVALAGGSASRALELTSDGRAQRMLEWALRIDAALTTCARDAGLLLEISEELSRSDELDLVLETLALFYRDVAAQRLGLPESELRFEPSASADAAAKISQSTAAARVAAITVLFDELSRNANAQIALDGALLGMA